MKRFPFEKMLFSNKVCSQQKYFDHLLKFRDVFRMSKVNDINSNIVSLHSDSEFLKLSLSLLQRMPNEDNNSLSLCLVLSVLQAELSNFDCIEKISFTIYCNFWLTLIKISLLISTCPIEFNNNPISLV